MRRWLLVLLIAGSLFAAPRPAHALHPNLRTLVVAGLWGAAIGTAAGLVTFPIHKEVKGIFLGSAIGLYAGLGIGVFHIFNQDNPQNPLARSPQEFRYVYAVPVLRF